VQRICAYFALELDAAPINCEAPLFGVEGFELAGHVFDSLSLAEVIVVLERDLCVAVLGIAGFADIESIAALARFFTQAAQPAALRRFEEEWPLCGDGE
jgi:hypothetical protein